VPYHEIIIDGTVNFLAETNKGNYVTTMKKADLLVPSVSAASIIAKVARDNYMIQQDDIYSNYGFKSHVGYGTAHHIVAIDKYGVTPIHRLSFSPLHKYAGPKIATKVFNNVIDNNQKQTTTKQIGDIAEDIASEYLVRAGHKIIDRNWKTKYCEIDIVSRKKDTLYFVEVKYRKKPDQGGGLAVISPKKLRQMKFAVEFYVLSNHLKDLNLRLAVISLGGQPPQVENYLEL
jgi:ribonuclease HII